MSMEKPISFSEALRYMGKGWVCYFIDSDENKRYFGFDADNDMCWSYRKDLSDKDYGPLSVSQIQSDWYIVEPNVVYLR